MKVLMKTKKKILIALLICGFAGAGLAWGIGSFPEQGQANNKLIRLHVIANSDSPEDQRVKLLVRDEVIKFLKPRLQNVHNTAEARREISHEALSLQAAANRCLGGEGASYQASVELGRFDFPAKSYGKLVLPEGNYEALRVVLGEGKGRNWWCVLFPPLCFVNIANSVVADVSNTVEPLDEIEAVNGQPVQVEIHFRFLDWWKNFNNTHSLSEKSQ